MEKVSKEQLLKRIQFENPWWSEGNIDEDYQGMQRREYLKLLYPLLKNEEINRAVVLMGPRRVGKTVLIYHAISQLIQDGVSPRRIIYFSIDTPLFNKCSLEELFDLARQVCGQPEPEGYFVFFDEIQYLKGWHVHLKRMVDSYRKCRFLASGSAAAALNRQSKESGAGRFTDFFLPPVTFSEFLSILQEKDLISLLENSEMMASKAFDIDKFNKVFVDYINYGGFPEAVLSVSIRKNPERFIRNDIIDKVLLRDLPGLYGIQDIQELNSLFTTLAFNSGNELSLDAIAKSSGVSKMTIKRYLEYLEAAFLVKLVSRLGDDGKSFKRQNFFKVYLTNPSIRSALFSPVMEEDSAMGTMTETAIFGQWFHLPMMNIHYARWNQARSKGEVDVVFRDQHGKPNALTEIKWTDRFANGEEKPSSLIYFCQKNGIHTAVMTTKTKISSKTIDGISIKFIPAALYCYWVGKGILIGKNILTQFLGNLGSKVDAIE